MLPPKKMNEIAELLEEYDKLFPPSTMEGIGTLMILPDVNMSYLKKKLQQAIDSKTPIDQNDKKIFAPYEKGMIY